MKKIILSIMFVLGIAVSVSAGEISCPVAGLDNYVVVTVKNPIHEVTSPGYHTGVTVYLEITKVQSEDVRVAVEILSLDLKTVYTTGVITIPKGQYAPNNGHTHITTYGIKDGTPVAIRIASASCKPY